VKFSLGKCRGRPISAILTVRSVLRHFTIAPAYKRSRPDLCTCSVCSARDHQGSAPQPFQFQRLEKNHNGTVVHIRKRSGNICNTNRTYEYHIINLIKTSLALNGHTNFSTAYVLAKSIASTNQQIGRP